MCFIFLFKSDTGVVIFFLLKCMYQASRVSCHLHLF